MSRWLVEMRGPAIAAGPCIALSVVGCGNGDVDAERSSTQKDNQAEPDVPPTTEAIWEHVEDELKYLGRSSSDMSYGHNQTAEHFGLQVGEVVRSYVEVEHERLGLPLSEEDLDFLTVSRLFWAGYHLWDGKWSYPGNRA